MQEALYRWAEHPGMTALPKSHFVNYWTKMPRPLTKADAQGAFNRFVRAGHLLLDCTPDTGGEPQ